MEKDTLTKEQEEKKKQFIKQFEDDIEHLKYLIDHVDQINHKILLLRRLKMSLVVAQLVAPYVVAAGITFGAFAIFGRTPFIADDKKRELHIQNEIDSLGNTRVIEQYDSFDEEKGNITYYEKWERGEDGEYFRNIKKYSIKNLDEAQINDLISHIDSIKLEDILGEATSIQVEKRNHLEEEDINHNPYIQAVFYSKDTNDYITVKEDVGENIAFTILWLIIIFIAAKSTDAVRQKYSSFDYQKSIYLIKEHNPLFYEEILQKKLKIRKDNYNRLMR